MDFKNGTRWGLGTRSVRTPGMEESQRLLLDADDQSDDYAYSSRSKGKQNKVSKVRKAKIEDSYSEDDEGNLIPLGGSSRPPRPLPVPDQCIEVSIIGNSHLSCTSIRKLSEFDTSIAYVKNYFLKTDNVSNFIF